MTTYPLNLPVTREAGGVRQPFSGNVDQTINPWTWFLRMSGVEIGQVNVYLGTSKDPDLERQILGTVGSYGRQLGAIGDALGVLVDRLDLKALSPAERDAIARLRDQLDLVDRLRRNARDRVADPVPARRADPPASPEA